MIFKNFISSSWQNVALFHNCMVSAYVRFNPAVNIGFSDHNYSISSIGDYPWTVQFCLQSLLERSGSWQSLELKHYTRELLTIRVYGLITVLALLAFIGQCLFVLHWGYYSNYPPPSQTFSLRTIVDSPIVTTNLFQNGAPNQINFNLIISDNLGQNTLGHPRSPVQCW